MKLVAVIPRSFWSCNSSASSRLCSATRRLYSAEAAKGSNTPKYTYPSVYEPFGPRLPPSQKVLDLADRIAALPTGELRQIGPTLLVRLNMAPPQTISGQGVDLGSQPASEKAEEKKEKTSFDVKLEKFDAAAKLAVIKEVRSITGLGLIEAKNLVQSAPCVLKQGVGKDEASKLVEQLKAIGAAAVME